MIVFGQMGSYHMDHAHTAELYVVMGALTVLAFYRHKKNIKRLLDGTETVSYTHLMSINMTILVIYAELMKWEEVPLQVRLWHVR